MNDHILQWIDLQLESARRKRERAATLGLEHEYEYFDRQVDRLHAERADYIRRYNLDGQGDLLTG